MMETAPVSGIDTTNSEEQARIKARADRFKAASGIREGDTEAVAAIEGALQHTATHCNTLQQTLMRNDLFSSWFLHCNTLQHAATHCSTLQHPPAHY